MDLQPSLYDTLQHIAPTPRSTWEPDIPPSLDGIHEITLNCETTGLRWFDHDRPIALSLGLLGGRSFYLPWGHRGGGNLSEETVKRWAQRELRGKLITNINTRFDVHMLRVWGIDLEAQGNEVSDVSHYAALLDDHRQHLSLDALIEDYFHETPIPRLDESRMADYHASEAAPRAQYNVTAVNCLKRVMWPLLDAQDLQRVRTLEDKVIYVVCEMEKNGSPIDVELLERMIQESQKQLETYLLQIAHEVGFSVNPDSPIDQERVFRQLNIPLEQTSTGRASFTDTVLQHIDHPMIQLMRRAGKLASLRSKFLIATRDAMGSDSMLRYALHQLRATRDDMGEAGTVTGRFSSTAIVLGVGCNIQQRMKATKQRASFGYDEYDASHDDEIFLVRTLHIPKSGFLFTSDMDQAQYRIFAHYVNNPQVVEAYQHDPSLSFHTFMQDRLKPHVTLTYGAQKNLNFAILFGAGLAKMALMLGHITAAEFQQIRQTKNYYNHPKLAQTREVKRIYDREIPEVPLLLARAAHLAKPTCDDRCHHGDLLHRTFEHKGYVRTLLGRRMRFPTGERLHKAFNSIDQGTEADVMKQKLVELHEARHQTGLVLRITNHDEVVGDIPDREHANLVHELLNRQSVPLRVPLTWTTTIGPNWADTT